MVIIFVTVRLNVVAVVVVGFCGSLRRNYNINLRTLLSAIVISKRIQCTDSQQHL